MRNILIILFIPSLIFAQNFDEIETDKLTVNQELIIRSKTIVELIDSVANLDEQDSTWNEITTGKINSLTTQNTNISLTSSSIILDVAGNDQTQIYNDFSYYGDGQNYIQMFNNNFLGGVEGNTAKFEGFDTITFSGIPRIKNGVSYVPEKDRDLITKGFADTAYSTSDTSNFARFADTALLSDTSFFAFKSDTAFYADTALYALNIVSNTSFPDADFSIFDNADATKIMNFEASGITSGQTRTLTVPNKSGTIALTSDLDTTFSDASFLIFNNINVTKAVQLDVSEVSNVTTRILTVPDQNGTIALSENIKSDAIDTVETHSFNSLQLDTLKSVSSVGMVFTNPNERFYFGTNTGSNPDIYFVNSTARLFYSGVKRNVLSASYLQGLQPDGITSAWRLSNSNAGNNAATTIQPNGGNPDVGFNASTDDDTLYIIAGSTTYYFAKDSAWNGNTGVRLDGGGSVIYWDDFSDRFINGDGTDTVAYLSDITVNDRRGSQSVTAGTGITITFSSTFPVGTSYIITTLYALDSDGYPVTITRVKNQGLAGFDIDIAFDATVYYKAEIL